jgi:class 3 adenylate cyclase
MAANRRLVSVVFCDVVGSTALAERLDPEAVSLVLRRYFSVMERAVERHGGRVEKFIGDAVVGVFGVPRSNEDDALRAVRAAIDMRDAVSDLNTELVDRWGLELQVRIAINTGQVLAGEGALVMGDTANVAARLQHMAPEGGVLLADQTYVLVRHAVSTRPLGMLDVRGRAAPIAVHDVVGLREEVAAFSAPIPTPFIGRSAEMRHLMAAFDRVAHGHRATVTILGEPGVGKSRLVRELLGEIRGRAMVLVGRCPAYGEAVTFRPLREMVRHLVGDGGIDALARLGHGEDDAALVADRIGAALDMTAPAPIDEIRWAVRRLVEWLARGEVLVMAVDDVHWAAVTFLDVLDDIGARARAPVLLVCTGRPELAEIAGFRNSHVLRSDVIRLERLGPTDATRLIRALASTTATETASLARVAEKADGNPLFIEQMLAYLRDTGDPDSGMPDTIRALLAMRIDQLESSERRVLELGSIEGRLFRVASVTAALQHDQSTDVPAILASLAERELVRFDRSSGDDDVYRFAHSLIQDAVYDAIPKERRADLHERHADWLTGHHERADADQDIGSHLERAYQLRVELGYTAASVAGVRQRAAERLRRAGLLAAERGDVPAAANLLDRAHELLCPGRARADLAPKRGWVLVSHGEIEQARRVLDEALEVACAEGDRALEWRLRAVVADTEDQPRQALRAQGARALRELGSSSAPRARGSAWLLQALGYEQADAAGWLEGAEHAYLCFRTAGERAEAGNALGMLTGALWVGPTPVDVALDRCHALLGEVEEWPTEQIAVLRTIAVLNAMDGDFSTAANVCTDAGDLAARFGQRFRMAFHHAYSGRIAELARDLGTAESEYRAGVVAFDEMAEPAGVLMGGLAAVLAQRGQWDKAAQLCVRLDETTQPDNVFARGSLQTLRSRLALAHDDVAQAAALARSADRLLSGHGFLEAEADASTALAEALLADSDVSGARTAAVRAVGLYTAKGNRVSADHVRNTYAQAM